MYKSTRRLTILTAVVLPMVTLTTAALADDDKTYPGAMCRPIGPQGTEATNVALIPTNGAMTNFSRVEQTWICPIVRHQVTHDPEFARITVMEDGTSRVSCQFVARGFKGEQFAEIGHTARSEPEIVQAMPLQVLVLYTWAGGEADVLSGVPAHGYYFFLCRVPAAVGPVGAPANQFAGVITYKVSEND